MKRQQLLVLISLISFALMPETSDASVVYTYTSPNFDTFTTPTSYTSEMSVSGTVELSAALTPNSGGPVVPISFSFSDGINTITEANLIVGGFNFSTDANGQIVEWAVLLQEIAPLSVGDQNALIVTSNSPSSTVGTPPANIGSFVTCTAVNPTTGDCISRITDSGSNQIAGTWTISTIPLPPSIFLFGSGLLGLIGIIRRKKAA